MKYAVLNLPVEGHESLDAVTYESYLDNATRKHIKNIIVFKIYIHIKTFSLAWIRNEISEKTRKRCKKQTNKENNNNRQKS